MSNTININQHTSCKDCAFAVYDNNTQTGCEFNILKYNEHVSCYDEDKEFYVVNIDCLYKRKGEYSETLYNQVDDLLSFDDFQVVIYCDSINEEDLKNTLESIKNQEVKPAVIVFMIEFGTFYHIDFFIENMKDSNIKWRVENQVVTSKGFRYLVDHMLVNPNLKHKWYALFTQGFVVDANYFKNLDTIINTEKRQILLVKPVDEHNGLVVHKMLDGFFGGSRQMKIEDKLDGYIASQELPENHLCIKYQEVI